VYVSIQNTSLNNPQPKPEVNYTRFVALTAVAMKIIGYWHLTPYSLSTSPALTEVSTAFLEYFLLMKG
jgi:hypothetical protein